MLKHVTPKDSRFGLGLAAFSPAQKEISSSDTHLLPSHSTVSCNHCLENLTRLVLTSQLLHRKASFSDLLL